MEKEGWCEGKLGRRAGLSRRFGRKGGGRGGKGEGGVTSEVEERGKRKKHREKDKMATDESGKKG